MKWNDKPQKPLESDTALELRCWELNLTPHQTDRIFNYRWAFKGWILVSGFGTYGWFPPDTPLLQAIKEVKGE